jgi:multicomponent Na+:H+ antiporter subunit D
MFLWFKPRWQRWCSLIGNAFVCIAAGIGLMQVTDGSIISIQAGNWAAPFGITFVYDSLSAMMILMSSLAGLAVGLFAGLSIKSNRAAFGFFPLYQFLLMGLYGAFLAGDIFNLYVWFEVIIISSFVLITLGGEKQQLAGAMKYVTLNMLASVIFLSGIAVLYGVLGTLNLADLSIKIASVQNDNLINTIAILFLIAFGIKSAVFPLYFWLPDSYHTPPAAVSAIFAGLLTKVGIYAYLRVFSLLFIQDVFIQHTLLILATAGMIMGAVGALRADNIRVLFSWLIISHIGFMIAGIGINTQDSLQGSLGYLMHDMIAKTALFLVAGIVFKMQGSFSMQKLGGLGNEYPRLSILLLIPVFAVAGTPPLSGFWPKILLIRSAWESGYTYVIAGILIASLLTLWVLARFISTCFWGTKKGDIHSPSFFESLSPLRKSGIVAPVAGLTMVLLILGLGFGRMNLLYKTTATQLKEPFKYIESVLPAERELKQPL